MVGRATGHDVHVLHLAQQRFGVDAENVRQNAMRADAALQGLAHRLRLLENLFLHVVVELAALYRVGRHPGRLDRPVRRFAIAVHDAVAAGVDGHHVAFLEVDEILGFGQQGIDVGGQEVFRFTHAQHHGAALAGADHDAGRACRHHRYGVGAVQAPHGGLHRLKQVLPLVQVFRHQVHHDLGIGLRGELVAIGLKLVAQLVVILDDAVVHQRHLVADGHGMCVTVTGHPVRGPARVGDAADAADRLLFQQFLQRPDLAHDPPALDGAFHLHGDAGRIVAPILERPEARDQDAADFTPGGSRDDAAHGQPSFFGRFQPLTAVCRARLTVS